MSRLLILDPPNFKGSTGSKFVVVEIGAETDVEIGAETDVEIDRLVVKGGEVFNFVAITELIGGTKVVESEYGIVTGGTGTCSGI